MALTRIRAVAARASWGAADQAIQSFANFVTLVVAARAVTPAEFGVFTLALAGITFEMTMASAAMAQPFAVLAASKTGDDYRRTLSSVLAAQGLFALLAAALVLAGAAVATSLGTTYAPLLIVVAAAIVAAQLQDFMRQALYVERRMRDACLNDIINYGGFFAGVVGLAVTGRLTAITAVGALVVASALAVGAGVLQLRRSIAWRIPVPEVIAINREHWAMGRWTLGVAVLSVWSNYLTPFVVGALTGTAAAGALRALYTVMGPVNIVFRTITMAFVPAAARTFDTKGITGLSALLRRAILTVLATVGLYAAVAAIGARPILHFVYGDAYAGIAWLMPIVAAGFVLGTISSVVDAAVRGLRITSTPFLVSSANFVAFWVVGVPAIAFFGLAGAASINLLMYTIALTLLTLRFRRERRRRAEPTFAPVSGSVGHQPLRASRS